MSSLMPPSWRDFLCSFIPTWQQAAGILGGGIFIGVCYLGYRYLRRPPPPPARTSILVQPGTSSGHDPNRHVTFNSKVVETKIPTRAEQQAEQEAQKQKEIQS